MSEKMYRMGLRILTATIAVVSNRKSLLPSFPLALEVKSLLTDFRAVAEVPFSPELDGSISLSETPGTNPSYRLRGKQAAFRGPLAELQKKASDLRFSLWGNQGFLYRFTLYLLEKRHRIYNLHACALFQPRQNRLYVIAGGPGSGKTVFLLSGLERGLELFSTETVHFRAAGGCVRWYMGSLVDNVRRGTLLHHFPGLLPASCSSRPEGEWQEKIALDLFRYRSRAETLVNPEVFLLFPRVEEGCRSFLLSRIRDSRKAAKALFDNISEKIAQSVVLYDKIPITGLDNADLAEVRLRSVERLVRHKKTALFASLRASPQDCWGDLLEG